MYENLFDYETLYRIRNDELEQNLEERRKLMFAAERKDMPMPRGSLFLVLQSFRNIFKQ